MDAGTARAPTVVADVSGAAAEALIPRIEAAVKNYPYANAGDYRVWPGPNSNTFVAAVLRAVPEIGVEMPPNALGRDFRPLPYAGLSDSQTGIEASLWGLLGVKIGWVEGIEINLLGLVVGLDLRHPALKLPGFGRIGIDAPTSACRGGAVIGDDTMLSAVRLTPWRIFPTPSPCATLGRCLQKFHSRRSGAAGSTRCRSMSAIAATSHACIATSMPGLVAPRR